MSQCLRSILLLSLYSLQLLASKAQTSLPDYSVVNYNSDNALPQNSIKGMAFDSNGFLWIGLKDPTDAEFAHLGSLWPAFQSRAPPVS